jgi:nicotinate dehydrogenase subunit A
MMSKTRHVTFTVNGKERSVETAPDTPLLYLLREALGLKGTRFGCGQASCGSCTVIVDGRAVTSCDLPAVAVDGKRVESVEVLSGENGDLHPLAKAALNCQAAQCGYCLPGILMAAKALLDVDPDPDETKIRQALDANLCRCGAHLRILRAVRMAAKEMREGRQG